MVTVGAFTFDQKAKVDLGIGVQFNELLRTQRLLRFRQRLLLV